MKKFYLAIVILTLPSISFAYSNATIKLSNSGILLWETLNVDKDYYGALDSDLITDNLGHLYLSEGGKLTQYDLLGNEVWHDDFTAFDMETDSSGNFYYSNYYEDIDFIESRNQDNVKRWQKKYKNYFFDDILLDRYDDVYLFATKKPNSYYIYNCSVHKYSNLGVIQWKKTISEDHGWPFSVHSVYMWDEQIIILGGTSDITEDDEEYFIVVSVLDLNGNELSFNYLEYADFDLAIIDQAGDLIVAWYDVKKYSINGQLLWQYEFDSLEVLDLTIDNDNNIIGMGRMLRSAQRDVSYNVVTFKLNSEGEMLWQKKYEREYLEAKTVLVDSVNNIVTVGYECQDSGEGYYDCRYFALKYDSDGELLWHETYQPYEGYSAFASDAVLDDEDNIYITGYSYDPTDVEDDDEPGCGCF
ncbi:MAG TPA: hypothetical protein PK961_07565 [bacterium]|nr:hypothetical protein [bacterium]